MTTPECGHLCRTQLRAVEHTHVFPLVPAHKLMRLMWERDLLSLTSCSLGDPTHEVPASPAHPPGQAGDIRAVAGSVHTARAPEKWGAAISCTQQRCRWLRAGLQPAVWLSPSSCKGACNNVPGARPSCKGRWHSETAGEGHSVAQWHVETSAGAWALVRQPMESHLPMCEDVSAQFTRLLLHVSTVPPRSRGS